MSHNRISYIYLIHFKNKKNNKRELYRVKIKFCDLVHQHYNSTI